MRLQIKGLAEVRDRLARIKPADTMAAALAEQAQRLAQAVQAELSVQPGEGGHTSPWQRSGALHDSIAAEAEGLHAVIGSNDKAAAAQETGTATVPARPFLAPVAAAMGEQVAHAIGTRLAAALRGEAEPEDQAAIPPRQVSST